MDFKKEIIKLLKKEIKDINADIIETPPNPEMGDYAMPCFTFAKAFKKSPKQIAQDLAKKIKPNKSIKEIKATGPYLNFFVNSYLQNKRVIESRIKKGNNKGVVTLDFSQPNIMKPFNIAHLRSTMIGNSLYRILSHTGYKVIGINHIGDWGTQFGKMMYAYEEWGNEKELNKNPIIYMLKLYVKFHKEAEKDPKLNEKGREWFARLEKGDKKARVYWKKFKDLSLKEYNKIYKRLDVHFDSWAGEAFYEPLLKDTIKLLDKKKLLKKSEGALIVDLEKYGLTPCIIQKSDGSTIYATRDVAAAIYRAKEYNFVKNLYVVDVRQSLHFKQFFKILELTGFKDVKNCEHLAFGMMRFKDGIMSTRKGKIVLLEEVLDKAVKKVDYIIKEKNPNLKNRKKVAEQVGIGAIIFWDLSHDRARDIEFNWDALLDFNGETGPYIQYSHARANSILKKVKIISKPAYDKLISSEERELIKQLSLFDSMVEKAAQQYKPSILAKYLVALCQRFNEFYQKCPISIEKDKSLAKARLNLVKKIKENIAYSLSLLSIQAPDQM